MEIGKQSRHLEIWRNGRALKFDKATKNYTASDLGDFMVICMNPTRNLVRTSVRKVGSFRDVG